MSMPRKRRFRRLASLCLAVLLTTMTAPVFAGPETGSPASLGALWRSLTAWLDTVIASMSGREANLITCVDPDGRAVACTSGEANHIPWADPYGRAATSSGGEANLIPWPDPAGHTATSSGGEANHIPYVDPNG